MDWQTTTTILGRLRNFDDRAMWERFHARFNRPIAAFARRFGLSDAQIEDVVQETLLAFAHAYQQGKYDRSQGRLSSWLFGIAYRQAANYKRADRDDSRRARQAEQTGFWQGVPDEPSASKAWETDWMEGVLRDCLAQVRREVSETTYRAFEFVEQRGLSAEEAGAQLGMTREAVYVAKHRVLKRLRELSREYEVLEGEEMARPAD